LLIRESSVNDIKKLKFLDPQFLNYVSQLTVKNMNEIDKYSRFLQIFDSLKLNDTSGRRTAYKPLYEYFQKLVLEVGVTLCNLDQNSLKISHLKTRWENVKSCLSYIEDPKEWDALINEINNIRQKVEHNDYYDPNSERLLEVRRKAPEFKDSVIRVAKEYYKKSKNFTFKEAFFHLSNLYIIEAEGLLEEYGIEPPYVVKTDYSLELEKYPYQQLSEIVKKLRERLGSIAKLEDVERSDLEELIQIVKIISHLRGKEEILLRYSVCPRCGGKIKETQKYVGGTPDDPEPTAVYCRVGCEKCDYELHSETINI